MITTYRHLIIIPFLFLGENTNHKLINLRSDNFNYNINNANQRKMGVSINLYRLSKAEKLGDINDLENQIKKTTDTKVDLYKITSDLAVIFSNSINPYSDTNSIPYKMLYGNYIQKSTSVGEVGGFLPSSEISKITKWIKTNKIETFDGFSKMYDNLSKEVKKELKEMGSDDKVSLFNGYVRPLVILYFTALENQNSVVFIGQ